MDQSSGSEIVAQDVSAWFGNHKVLDRVSLTMEAGQVTALIGPSGCGKSTFLRILNRMHELVPGATLAGDVLMDGKDIYGVGQRAALTRQHIGMVFQKPNPFPAMSIYDNVLSGLKLARIKTSDPDDLVETQPAPGGPVERGRPAARTSGRGIVRRAAAAAVHRAGTCGVSGGAPHGRAVFSARPDVDPTGRGDDFRSCPDH